MGTLFCLKTNDQLFTPLQNEHSIGHDFSEKSKIKFKNIIEDLWFGFDL